MIIINPKMEKLHSLAKDLAVECVNRKKINKKYYDDIGSKALDFFSYINEQNLHGQSIGVFIAEKAKIYNEMPNGVETNYIFELIVNAAKENPFLSRQLDKYKEIISRHYGKNLEKRRDLILSRSVRYDNKRAEMLENNKSAHNLHKRNIIEDFYIGIRRLFREVEE